MKIKLAFYLTLIINISFAQGEANIWYFGEKAGLDFSSGTPVAITNGELSTQEGCATLSNAAGQLLFYTDGITVYNRNHQIMLNGFGLMGDTSTSQSATIVPKPGSSTLFYVFTIDAGAGPRGFRYSEIDITLDNGLGGITGNKNVLIYAPTCEKIAVVKHANNSDFWIITHGWNSNIFYAHKLSSTGLDLSPISSSSGIIVNDSSTTKSMGYMKISPDGSKLIVCHQFLETAELFDFDNLTGFVSNSRVILNDFGHIYGAEFSPNNEVLYISTILSRKLYQFDLLSSDIPASMVVLYDGTFNLGALQLAPDGKIYLALYNQNKLGVITNPNTVGLGCNFQLNAIDLGGRISQFGLPAFNQSFFFNPSIKLENACVGQNAQFELTTNQTITSAIWDFGDGTGTQNSIIGTHTYATPGPYTVSVFATSTSGTGTKTRDITISAVPTATTPPNILQCDDNNNGVYNFDLTTRRLAILNGQDPTAYSVRYFANAAAYTSNTPIDTPSNYPNAVAYQQQTITAEVYNNANGECNATTTFHIDVFDTPRPQTSANIPILKACDNTTVGTDTDGRILFNLTQRATAILNGQSNTQFTIGYYLDAAFTTLIPIPAIYQNTNATETIYVKVTNNDNVACFATTSFNIQVEALPTVAAMVNLKQCDDDIDGFSVFNLTQANALISSNFTNETIAFFETLLEAQSSSSNPIPNQTTYTNQTVSNDVVYVRITSANGCSRTAQLNLIVSTTQVPVNFTRSFTECDDALLGTNTDGIATFNFASVDTEVRALFPIGQQLTITYYRNLPEALQETNFITDISNYRNTGYANTQNIYTRVDSDLNNECLLLKSFITLNVERIPIGNPIIRIHCDDDQDGKYGFDTTTVEASVLNGLTNVNVTYFDQNNNPIPSPLPNPYVTASQTLRVVLTNNTAKACNYETTIKFIVDVLPTATSIPATRTTQCDDELYPVAYDGKYAFDTSNFQNTILNGQTNRIVRYYDGNNNLLSSPLPNPFLTATQTVRVEVINPSNTTCKATTTIPFVVHPAPAISQTGTELVCNEPTLQKTINAGNVDNTPPATYTYIWKRNGNLIAGQNGYELDINQEGVYTVEVSNLQGCKRTRTITVTASDKATITSVEIIDLASPNSITVQVSGAGDYVFTLDDPNGIYQEDNTFTNVTAGIHTIYIKDLNGCGTVPKEVAVLGIPNYFTPNGDGFNDYWNIKGANATLNANTTIYIFDRLGKLIKQITPTTQGWNGTFNGQQLPATDYWYTIQLENGKTVKGHFALKR